MVDNIGLEKVIMYLRVNSLRIKMQNYSRYMLVSCVVLFGLSYFAVKFPDFEYSTVISNLLIFLMAAPSYLVLIGWLGKKRGGFTLLFFSVLPLFVEAFAVITGIPYGTFVYSNDLGFKLFGLVPISVSFAYLPILLGAVAIAGHKSKDIVTRSVFGGIISVAIDLVIDPATVAGGLWMYENGGTFFGVPLSNYIGWLLTGTVYSYIFFKLNETQVEFPLGLTDSLLLILSFWTGFLMWKGLSLPAIIGLAYIVYLVKYFK